MYLVPFTNDYSRRITASEIARLTKSPQRTVARALNQLTKLNLLRFEINGRNKLYFLDLKNTKTTLLLQNIEAYKALQFSINSKAFIAIEPIIAQREVILFGSYAKGKATKDSDLDILILGKKTDKMKKLCRNTIPTINPHFATIKEFNNLKTTLAKEILKNHIIFGGAQFTELCLKYYE